MAKLQMSYSLSLLLLLFNVGSQGEDHSTTFEQFYELGMDAYRQEKWSKCSTFIQRAINDYHFFRNTIIDCRLNCRKDSTTTFSLPKLRFFHEMIEDSNCLRRCKKKSFGMRPERPQPSALDKKFEQRVPYNFLQFCLFKEGKLKEAAAAAYTFYISNQDDKRILGDLQYYKSQEDLTDSDFVDLERRPHQSAYVKALMAYNEGDWETAVEEFEQSLELYFKEEERCRMGCERSFTHTGYPDFVSAVADHYIVVIVCQQKCLQKLSTFGMDELENFVSEHYNYLQFAYYNLEDYGKAAIAVANFLLLRPDNEEMSDNKDYYIKNLGLNENKFIPSQDIVDYINYWRDLESSLDFVRDKYALPSDDIIDEEEEDLEDDKREANGTQEHYMQKYAKVGIRLFAEAEQLKGTSRFAADEFFREDQCLSLADLARSQKPNKIGVASISLPEIVKLVKDDEEYEMSLRLLLRAGDIMELYTAAYFNQSKLYISEVKVVCRSGGDKWEKEMPRDCVPQEDGSCLGDSHTNSDFLSIAYLSDINDGTGSFYFMDSQHKIQSSLQPRCGRLVGFPTTDSYGVNFSWKKECCALLMTLTSDPGLELEDIQEAKDLLTDLEETMVKESNSFDNTAILNEFYRQGVSIVTTGEDLFGKERFAADGLATQKECEELISLARKGVLKDDGYDKTDKANNPRGSKFVSPYSKHESFAGLNISRAVKLVAADRMSPHSLQLLLDITEQGRLLVERYFNLTKPLYFDFTHLVCRTAVEDSEGNRGEDLSHPVHSDNCMIQDDGSCIADDLAYSQRHYSALLYLNGDFDGGEFFFAHKNRSEQVSLQPKCGRIVGFNAGDYHGVKAVIKGQRCALAMWLTHDPNFKEISRAHAQRQLDIITRKSKMATAKTDKKSKSSIKDTNEKSNLDDDDVDENTKSNNELTDEAENLENDLNEVEKIESDKQMTLDELEETINEKEIPLETFLGHNLDKETDLDIEDSNSEAKIESDEQITLDELEKTESEEEEENNLEELEVDLDKKTDLNIEDSNIDATYEEFDTRDEL